MSRQKSLTGITAFALLCAALMLLAGCAKPVEQPPSGGNTTPAPGNESGGTIPSIEPGCWVLKDADRDRCFAAEAARQGAVTECYLVQDNATKEACIYPFALNNTDLCGDLSGTLRDDCYLHAAGATANRTMCDQIADPAKAVQCTDSFRVPCDDASPVGYNITMCEAENARDVSKCLDGSNFADACAFDYSLEFKDKDACQVINDEAMKYACLAIYANDSSYCASPQNYEKRDLCRIIVAEQLGDVDVCAGVSLGSEAQYIYATQGTVSYLVQCYADVGIKLKNYSVCAIPASGLDRDHCYDLVARGAVLPDACGKIYFSSGGGLNSISDMHDSCYRDVAKMLGDPSVCNSMVASGRERFCYWPIITRKPSIGGTYNFTLDQCSKIVNPEWKWLCVSEVAQRDGDLAICDIIPSVGQPASTREFCLQHVGKVGSATYCESFQNGTGKDGCYRDLAKMLGDPSICNSIVDNATRNTYCYWEIILGVTATGAYKYEFTLDQCLAISDENVKWTCIIDLADRTRNKTICDSIPANATSTVTTGSYVTSMPARTKCLQNVGG
ncbi:Uncharacterised protein [Candidatus Burarchaeum australiense]|nr:Uncharacterised protein [Candidatus Burarchaeum australiense]